MLQVLQSWPLGKRLCHAVDQPRKCPPGNRFCPRFQKEVSRRKVAEPKCSLVQSSEVLDEEINEIAQVHCENKVLEFDLCNRSPSANVKGNLRRNLAFWKRIETSKFILNVIDRRYFLPFLNLAEPAAFANSRSSLIHAVFCRVSDTRASRFGSCRRNNRFYVGG